MEKSPFKPLLHSKGRRIPSLESDLWRPTSFTVSFCNADLI